MKQFLDSKTKRVDFLDERFYIDTRNKKEVYVPSVTHILDYGYPRGKAFLDWLKRNGQSADLIAGRAMDSGSRVHQAIDAINKGLLVKWYEDNNKAEYDRREWEMIHNYIDFITTHNVILLASEYKFANAALGYGGTLDCVFYFMDTKEVWIIDIKTGNEYRIHELQLVAYLDGWNGEEQVVKKNMQAVKCGVLYLEAGTRTTGKGDKIQGRGWKLDPVPDLAYQRKIWQATQTLYKDNPDAPKSPTIYSMPSEVNGKTITALMQFRIKARVKGSKPTAKTDKKQASGQRGGVKNGKKVQPTNKGGTGLKSQTKQTELFSTKPDGKRQKRGNRK